RAAHQKGTAHEFTPEEARIAGRRGGSIVSRNRAHMAEIGRKGGQSPSSARTKARGEQNGPARTEPSPAPSQPAPHAGALHAIDMIKEDHQRVNELFRQYETARAHGPHKAHLIDRICRELDIHARLEEEIFYPAVRAKVDEPGKQCVSEAVKEHQSIKDLIRQLQRHDADDGGEYHGTVQELLECVTHHVDEEEKTVLPMAAERLRDELEQLGARMRQRKQQLQDSLPPQERTQPGQAPRQGQGSQVEGHYTT
ncbi:MAG: hemerythrin domain-containing protein, partial [Thermodesulfobacteriota bacterium]